MSNITKTILVTDRMTHESLVTLESQGFFRIRKAQNPHIQDEDLTDVHGMIIRSKTHIDKEVLQRAPSLQVVVSATSGFDHIDFEATGKWGITVMHTPEANVASAAELSFGLMLACARKLAVLTQQTKSAIWDRHLGLGTELSEKTLGIVGLGRIGGRVARIAQAMGMRTLAYDPYVEDSRFQETQCERVAYEEVLKLSDVLTFHVPKTALTHRMLNRSHLEHIHRGIILLNTSRGGVISEMDLLEALDEGWIGAAGLDVFEKEPLPKDSKLQNHSKLILTPHAGALTKEAFHKSSDQAVLKTIQFFVDGSTSSTLPPKEAWYTSPSPWVS